MRIRAAVPTWSRGWSRSDLERELEFWDPVRWQPRTVAPHCWMWITATRRRRWIFWGLAVFVVLVVLPVVLGAVAGAQTDTGAVQSGGNSALGWTNLRDSYGVDVSRYMYVSSEGSIFHPVDTVVAITLGIMCALFLIIATVPIWLFGSALSLGWLDFINAPLKGAAEKFTGQIATPMVFLVFVTIGAFFVAYFVVRGFHAKATVQVVTLLAVAIMSTVFLKDPLGEVLSSDGMLAQGRNVGLSVAAGLNGDSNPNPSALVVTMQEDLIDNFVRHPLQVWNYGHVVDERSACASAWSSGVSAGSESQVKKGLKACGDSAAAAAADQPTMWQVGAGLVLLLVMLLALMPFFTYMSIKIMWSALDSIYWGFMGIFGFAAGGYVYGPTQTFTVRSVVHGLFSFCRMAAEMILVAVVALIEDDLLRQAKGREMAVLFITAVVMIVAFLQARRFSGSLDHGNEWVANRFALAIQNGGARIGSGSGSGSSTALGMGQLGASHKMSSLGMMALMGGASTIANSPLTEWAMMGLPGSLHPQSRLKKATAKAQGGVWAEEGRFGGPEGWYAQSYMNRELFAANAAAEAREYGGLDSFLGNAAAVQGVIDVGGMAADSFGAMIGAGAKDERRARLAARSREVIGKAARNEPLQDADLAFLAASVRHAQNSARLLVAGKGSAEETAADFGTLQQAAREFRRVRAGGVTLDDGHPTDHRQRDYVEEYMRDLRNNPEEAIAKMGALNDVINSKQFDPGVSNTARARLHTANVDAVQAERMKQWIFNEHAKDAENATKRLIQNAADPDAIRDLRDVVYQAVRTEHLGAGRTGDMSNTVTPRGGNASNPDWKPNMEEVARLLRN